MSCALGVLRLPVHQFHSVSLVKPSFQADDIIGLVCRHIIEIANDRDGRDAIVLWDGRSSVDRFGQSDRMAIARLRAGGNAILRVPDSQPELAEAFLEEILGRIAVLIDLRHCFRNAVDGYSNGITVHGLFLGCYMG